VVYLTCFMITPLVDIFHLPLPRRQLTKSRVSPVKGTGQPAFSMKYSRSLVRGMRQRAQSSLPLNRLTRSRAWKR